LLLFPRTFSSYLVLCVLLLPFLDLSAPQGESKLVQVGKDGTLIYLPDENGNVIPDFSYCGFKAGGIELPQAAVKRSVQPAEGDDGIRIQQAIDEVARLPADHHGLRGAVLLKRGRYEISGSLKIAHSGVVLRGEGQGEEGTVLVATGVTKRTFIEVGGEGRPREVRNTRREITDNYVPVGARSFHVTDSTGMKVGDTVIVHRPSTANWIHDLGMDRIPPRRDGQPITQWKPGSKDLLFDRVIPGINGNRITIDAPFTNALEKKYGGGTIYGYEFPGRIELVGIENLRGVLNLRAQKMNSMPGTL
jgi:hypothetical protein